MDPVSASHAVSGRVVCGRRHLPLSTLGLATLVILIAGLLASCSEDAAQPSPSSVPFEWPVAAPESQDLDGAVLDTLTARLARGEFGRISSLLIVRQGYLVYEEYFRDMAQDQLHDAYSVTKSVASALIGIAIDEGMLEGVDVKLVDFFSEYSDVPAAADDRYPRNTITLEHVLSMQAGFQWDELSVPYGTAQNPFTGLLETDDMFRYALDRPVVTEPGTGFHYNSGSSMLLAGILQQVSGKNVREFAVEHLFGPLDITFFGWRRGGNYVYMLGSGLELLPRDMAKFGYLYANDGVWQGQRLISSEWIQESWRTRAEIGDGRTYGYHWWLRPQEPGSGIEVLPYALGWGEQYVLIVPEIEMVVVSTAEKYRQQDQLIAEVMNVIGEALRLDP